MFLNSKIIPLLLDFSGKLLYNNGEINQRKGQMMSFLLETAADPWSSIISIGSIVLLIVFFYFFMIRPQKKKEKEDQEMRDALSVGDEVTTIGGIIGKVISIKEDTFVLETTKAKTRIRFLKGAIRSVDVRIADTIDPKVEETETAPTEPVETAEGQDK